MKDVHWMKLKYFNFLGKKSIHLVDNKTLLNFMAFRMV